MPKEKQFKRAHQSSRGLTEDLSGRVHVMVRLVDERGVRVENSISRSVTITAGKVSEVFEIIEKALFGDSLE